MDIIILICLILIPTIIGGRIAVYGFLKGFNKRMDNMDNKEEASWDSEKGVWYYERDK